VPLGHLLGLDPSFKGIKKVYPCGLEIDDIFIHEWIYSKFNNNLWLLKEEFSLVREQKNNYV